jgi:hypothetical protein
MMEEWKRERDKGKVGIDSKEVRERGPWKILGTKKEGIMLDVAYGGG